jgi:hypothetical protein
MYTTILLSTLVPLSVLALIFILLAVFGVFDKNTSNTPIPILPPITSVTPTPTETEIPDVIVKECVNHGAWKVTNIQQPRTDGTGTIDGVLSRNSLDGQASMIAMNADLQYGKFSSEQLFGDDMLPIASTFSLINGMSFNASVSSINNEYIALTSNIADNQPLFISLFKRNLVTGITANDFLSTLKLTSILDPLTLRISALALDQFLPTTLIVSHKHTNGISRLSSIQYNTTANTWTQDDEIAVANDETWTFDKIITTSDPNFAVVIIEVEGDNRRLGMLRRTNLEGKWQLDQSKTFAPATPDIPNYGLVYSTSPNGMYVCMVQPYFSEFGFRLFIWVREGNEYVLKHTQEPLGLGYGINILIRDSGEILVGSISQVYVSQVDTMSNPSETLTLAIQPTGNRAYSGYFNGAAFTYNQTSLHSGFSLSYTTDEFGIIYSQLYYLEAECDDE